MLSGTITAVEKFWLGMDWSEGTETCRGGERRHYAGAGSDKWRMGISADRIAVTSDDC